MKRKIDEQSRPSNISSCFGDRENGVRIELKHVVTEILAILPELAVRICLQSEEFQILFSYPKNKAALQ